ncbi:hypothetical protein RBB79_18100 [Tunturiibacter empetritectus]|uniref:Uncharacterized protein n=1 Tax=Tunturiibacter lichenicola TaxID=2051959 RepID=A0A852VNC9_9BACT|nr:hypothetical protein [Edaphobacter lichenicola]NYF91565.1 hypothetical protein [Edaphobacter lichenicola]
MLLPKILGIHSDFRRVFASSIFMFDPDAHTPRPNRNLIYYGACIIAGLRLARQNQVNVRVIPIGVAVGESIELAHDIYSRVFRLMPKAMEKVH